MSLIATERTDEILLFSYCGLIDWIFNWSYSSRSSCDNKLVKRVIMLTTPAIKKKVESVRDLRKFLIISPVDRSASSWLLYMSRISLLKHEKCYIWVRISIQKHAHINSVKHQNVSASDWSLQSSLESLVKT